MPRCRRERAEEVRHKQETEKSPAAAVYMGPRGPARPPPRVSHMALYMTGT